MNSMSFAVLGKEKSCQNYHLESLESRVFFVLFFSSCPKMCELSLSRRISDFYHSSSIIFQNIAFF